MRGKWETTETFSPGPVISSAELAKWPIAAINQICVVPQHLHICYQPAQRAKALIPLSHFVVLFHGTP